MRHPQLRELVIEQSKALWSPEQIAGRLLADGVSAVRVCTETIYRFIYGKEPAGYHNGLILLMIDRSSGIGTSVWQARML